ncbi:hypothetical protein [Streptomyces sp. NPDC127020]|uniref:hypothetical protein n=1 Tax=Streptomyces sp. NPDC127020 TaxID=3347109 RepID=UPI00365DC9F5
MKMPDVNECQICGAPAPLIAGQCDGVAGYRLMRDPWAPNPSFLDGNLHFSCLVESEKNTEFYGEFTRMLRAGHEEIPSLDGSLPPLTRMGLGMTEIFSGQECSVFQSDVADRWMVVQHSGPWFRLRLDDLTEISHGDIPRSPSDVVPYRLPIDVGDDVDAMGLRDLLSTLGVEDKYEPDHVDYEALDYYAPKRLLEYVARSPLVIPAEAVAFLSTYVENYIPVTYEDES